EVIRTLTLTATKADGQGLCFGLAFAYIRRCIPYPASVTAHIGRQFHFRYNCRSNQPLHQHEFPWRTVNPHIGGVLHTVVVCADLQRLVSSHYQACLVVVLMLQQPHITCSALFPFPRLTVELEEFRMHLESL